MIWAQAFMDYAGQHPWWTLVFLLAFKPVRAYLNFGDKK